MYLSRECRIVAITATILVVATQINGVMNMKMPKLQLECLGEKHDMMYYIKGSMRCAAEHMSKEDLDAIKDPKTTMEKRIELGKKAHKNTCIRVCQWKKHQMMLTSDGKLNETSVNEMTDKLFPESVRAEVKESTKKCHTDHSKTFDDKNNCEGYQPFETCLKDLFKKVCKIEKFPGEDMM